MTTQGAWLLTLLAAASTCAGNLLLRQARAQGGAGGFWAVMLSPWSIGGIACYMLTMILFSKSLQRLPVSLVYPVQATVSFGMLAVAARILFNETMSPGQWVGIGTILVGTFLVGCAR